MPASKIGVENQILSRSIQLKTCTTPSNENIVQVAMILFSKFNPFVSWTKPKELNYAVGINFDPSNLLEARYIKAATVDLE